MAAALGRLGFDVTTVRDADRVAMNEALRAFTRESAAREKERAAGWAPDASAVAMDHGV